MTERIKASKGKGHHRGSHRREAGNDRRVPGEGHLSMVGLISLLVLILLGLAAGWPALERIDYLQTLV
jgi:hypothetical protein